MPIYQYQHPKTKKVVEVIQTMSEAHEYVDSEGVKWNRVFVVPNAAIDTKADAFNAKDFIKTTSNKRETMGDIWDRAKELSEKRKDKVGGVDPIKEKYWDEWSKKRKGRKPPEAIKNK